MERISCVVIFAFCMVAAGVGFLAGDLCGDSSDKKQIPKPQVWACVQSGNKLNCQYTEHFYTTSKNFLVDEAK